MVKSGRLWLLTLLALLSPTGLRAQLVSGETTLIFNYIAGSNALPTQYLQLLQTSFTVTATVATPAGSSWLSVSPTSPYTGAVTVSITSAAENLPNGSYSGSIVVTPTSGGLTETVAVQLNVSAGTSTGRLLIAPASLNFTSGSIQQGITITSADPTQPNVQFTSPSVSLVAGYGTEWLALFGPSGPIYTLDPQILTTPITVSVAVEEGVDSETGTINIGGLLIPVSYTAEIPVNVGVSPASLNFSEQIGGPAAPSQMVQVSATGGAALPFSVKASPGITVTPIIGTTPATLTVSIAAATGNPPPGSGVFGNVDILAADGTIYQFIPVDLTLTQASTLSVSPSTLYFGYQIGGQPPPAQTVQVTGAAGAALSFEDSSNSAVPNWISVSPTQGVTPSTLTVSVAASNLQPGVYSGSVSVGTGSGNGLSVPVTLTVAPAPVAIAASPSTVSEFVQFGPSPAPVSIQLTSGTASQVSFTTATSGGNWFSVTPSSGVTPATLAVSINMANVSAGNSYSGSITIIPSSGQAITIPVAVTVSQPPAISAYPASLNFVYQTGGPAPSAQSVQVSANDGPSDTFKITLLSSPSGQHASYQWLTVTPLSGTLPTTLSVAIDPTGLADGLYGLSILITARDSTGATTTQTIPVNLTVTTTSTVSVSNTSISVSLPSGSAAVQQTLQVTGTASSAVPFTASATSSTNWLLVSPSSGITPATLSISISPTVLTPALYDGSITITPAGGPAITIPVSLTVIIPSISASPPSLSFSYQTGGAQPAPQSIQVSAALAQPFTATITSLSTPGNWLSITPASGTAPSAVSVSVAPAGLAPGTYIATISIATATPGASQSITAVLTVTATGTLFPEIDAVVNAGSFASGGIAPGEIVTIGGANLGPADPLGLTLNSNGTVSTSLGGVSVSFDGYLAPLIYVSASQINCVVPYEIASISSPWAQVRNSLGISSLFQLTLAAAAPAIFTADGSGSGPAAVTNGSGSANGPTNPAAAGSTIVIYLTGEGQTSPAGVTGQVTAVNSAGTGPLTPQPVLPLTVTIGGQPADVSFFGEAPGLVSGAVQINAVVPQAISSGAAPLVVTLGNAVTQPGVTVYVSSN